MSSVIKDLGGNFAEIVHKNILGASVFERFTADVAAVDPKVVEEKKKPCYSMRTILIKSLLFYAFYVSYTLNRDRSVRTSLGLPGLAGIFSTLVSLLFVSMAGPVLYLVALLFSVFEGLGSFFAPVSIPNGGRWADALGTLGKTNALFSPFTMLSSVGGK